MQELAQRVYPQTGYTSIGDLAWNYTLTYDRPQDNPTALWREQGEVQAWGWLQLPGVLWLQVDPAHAELAGDVLDWAEAYATSALAIDVADSEHAVVSALAERGYQPQDGPFFSCLSMSLTDIPAAPTLPDGYQIGQVTCDCHFPSDEEIARRVAVHRSAFDGSKFDATRYLHMMEVYPYRTSLDLVVEAPDGSFASYCLGWYDERNQIGQFEPVGTHPDHRQQHLATAVTIAVLRGFQAAGGEHAIVNARGDADYPAPKRLYESLGFRQHTRTRTYRRQG